MFSQYLSWIDSQLRSMTRLLETWANINSFSYDLAGLSRMAGALEAEFSSLAPVARIDLPPATSIDSKAQTMSAPLGELLRLTIRPEAPIRVLLNIHYDTVYPPDSPFQSCSRSDEALRGPGVLDAKGGIIVLLTALRAFERTPWANKIGFEVLLNPDEEIGSPGSARFFIEAAKGNHLAMLFEPALPDGALVDSRKGSGNFTIIVRGRAAHAGRDFHAGRNAITALARLLLQIEECCKDLPNVTINIAKVEGGGPLNVVPDLAIVRLNVRVTTTAEQQTIEQRLKELVPQTLADGITGQLVGQFGAPPKTLDPRSAILLKGLIACGAELGVTLTHKPSGGASDGNRLAAAGLPVIDSLGPVGADLHSDREHIRISSLTERAKLTALYLMKLASGQLQPPA
jgi:glutamate carboxypeptidase